VGRLRILSILTLGVTACAKPAGGSAVTSVPRIGTEGTAVAIVGTSTVAATSGREAIAAFLAAAKAQNLPGMSAVWGTNQGPAVAHLKADEAEKRLIIMQCLVTHDQWTFAEERARLVMGGRQEYLVRLRLRETTVQTTFTAIEGPGRRWYVETIDLAPLRDLCR